MKAAVISGHSSWHNDRNGESTTTLPRSEASDTAWPLLVAQLDLLGRGLVEHEAFVGRRRRGRGRAAGGEDDAEDKENEDEGAAGRQTGQSSSSPGGRKVKGRSASEMSVEAIQRVRPSKTGVIESGSSSWCSLKRTEPS